MISGPRNLLWLIPLALLLTSPLWKGPFVRLLMPHGEESAPVTTPRERTVALTGVELNRYENGKQEMLLAAERVESGRDGLNLLSLAGVDLRLFVEGEPRAHITCGEGSFDTVRRLITLVEDVTVTTSDELELRTDALRYFLNKKTMKTATPVLFQSPRVTLRGIGMMYHFGSGDYRVGGRVVGDMM